MATQQQVAHYQGLASEAEHLAGGPFGALRARNRDYMTAAVAEIRREQIERQKQQAARIAGLTWGDVACAIRALGMPEASEDFTRVCYQCDDQMPKTEEDCVEFGRSSESAKMLIAAMDAIAKAEGR